MDRDEPGRDMGAVDDRASSRWRRETMAEFNSGREVLDEVAKELFHRDGYRDLPAAERARVRADLGRVFDALTGAVTEDREFTAAEEAVFLEIGVARARQGVPLEEVLGGFRMGAGRCELLLRQLMDSNRPDDPADAVALLESLRGSISAAEGLLRAAVVARSVPLPNGPGTALLEAMLDGEDQAALRKLASPLGYPFGNPCALVVTTPAVGGELPVAATCGLAAHLAKVVPGAVGATVRLEPVPHAVVLSLTAWEPCAAVEEAVGGHEGTVTVLPGLFDELADGYRQLRPLLPDAGRLSDEPPVLSIPRLEMLGGLLLLADQERARVFVRAMTGQLRALPRDGEGEKPERWLRSLDGYLLAAGNIAEASERTGHDRKTVYAHLGHIERLTGLDPRQPPHRLLLALAQLYERIYEMPPRGDPWWASDGEWA